MWIFVHQQRNSCTNLQLFLCRSQPIYELSPIEKGKNEQPFLKKGKCVLQKTNSPFPKKDYSFFFVYRLQTLKMQGSDQNVRAL